MNFKYIYTLAAVILSLSLSGQQVQKSTYGTVLLDNATVHTISEAPFQGDVLIEDGKIKEVGPEITVPSGTKIIDCSGLNVYPGFIDGGTRLGLSEVSAISLTNDYNELGDFNPHMDALTAVNPNSVSIPVTRTNGVTTVLTAPSGGLFPGKASLIHLHGYTPKEMYAGFEGIVMQFPASGKRGRWDRRSEEDIKKDAEKALKKLNKIWDSVTRYASMDSIARATKASKSRYNPQMDALLPVVSKEMPLLIRVNKKDDILSAIKWLKDKDINAIFTSVSEGWRVAKEIAEAKIPCIVGPILRNPSRGHDRYDMPYKNAGLLNKAGVKLAIMTNEIENVRNLPFNAGFAATYGLGKEGALKAITLDAAEIFGLGDVLGSIEAGKIANLLVVDGDPFEPKSQLKHLFIGGWDVPLESRHTLLYDEFLERGK